MKYEILFTYTSTVFWILELLCLPLILSDSQLQENILGAGFPFEIVTFLTIKIVLYFIGIHLLVAHIFFITGFFNDEVHCLIHCIADWIALYVLTTR